MNESRLGYNITGDFHLLRNDSAERGMNNDIFIFVLAHTAGVDYISISEQSLSIQPGETRKCITFNVIEDDIVEGEESLTVQIQSSMLVIGIPDTAEVNIVDTSREYK